VEDAKDFAKTFVETRQVANAERDDGAIHRSIAHRE